MDETALLDRLQEPMEAIGLGQEANSGRFCGHCYARLASPKQARAPGGISCDVCGNSTDAIASVASVPSEVLALYLAKRKREGLLVNSFAMFGIVVAMVLSALLWLLLPGGWFDLLPFVLLIAGSYYLARIFGLWIGATIGYNSGRSVRDRRWTQFLAERSTALPSGSAPEPRTRKP